MTATMFQLARNCFEPQVSSFVHELVAPTPAGQLWIQKYGQKEALSSYRQTKSAIYLQMDFVSARGEVWSKIFKSFPSTPSTQIPGS